MLRKATWLFSHLYVLICIAMLLVACGGGASSKSDTMPPASSRNDQTSTKKNTNLPPISAIAMQSCPVDALSVSMKSAPQISAQTGIYFASMGQQGSIIYAVNAHDGTARWCEKAAVVGAPSCSGNVSVDSKCQPAVKARIGAATVANDMMYVCVAEFGGGYTFAFNVHDGSLRWHYKTDCQPTDVPFADPAQPIVDNGVVYIGSPGGGVYAFAVDTGAVIWYTNSSVSLASLQNGVLYGYSYNANESAIYALRAHDGTVLWKYNLFPRAVVSDLPTVANGSVYFATLDLDNTFYALNAANGTLRWSYHIGAVASVSALVTNNIVYIGTFNNGMYAFSAHDGQILWHTGAHCTTQSTPVIANGAMYLSMTDGIYALNPATGRVLWRNLLAIDPSFLTFTKVVVSEGVVYVGVTDDNGNGRLQAIDARYGTDFWQIAGIGQVQPITVA